MSFFGVIQNVIQKRRRLEIENFLSLYSEKLNNSSQGNKKTAPLSKERSGRNWQSLYFLLCLSVSTGCSLIPRDLYLPSGQRIRFRWRVHVAARNDKSLDPHLSRIRFKAPSGKKGTVDTLTL
jgi:hypothetical protein